MSETKNRVGEARSGHCGRGEEQRGHFLLQYIYVFCIYMLQVCSNRVNMSNCLFLSGSCWLTAGAFIQTEEQSKQKTLFKGSLNFRFY